MLVGAVESWLRSCCASVPVLVRKRLAYRSFVYQLLENTEWIEIWCTLQTPSIHIGPEEGDSIFHRNTSIHRQDYTASQAGGQNSSRCSIYVILSRKVKVGLQASATV